MTGSNTGVFTQLIQKFPRLVRWHCLNHHLELSASDVVKASVVVNHFKCFMDTLYALYSTQSSKNKRELSAVAVEVRLSSQYTVGGLIISNCKGRFAQL